LERFATEWNIIMLVVETFLKPNQIDFHIKGFEIIRFIRSTNRGNGIAFLIKKNLIFYSITLNFNPRTLKVGVISISTSKGHSTLVFCY